MNLALKYVYIVCLLKIGHIKALLCHQAQADEVDWSQTGNR